MPYSRTSSRTSRCAISRSTSPTQETIFRRLVNPDPSQEYKTRLAARRKTIERYRKIDRIVAVLRLTAGILFFFLLFNGFRWSLLLPAAAFVGFIPYHDNIL